MKKDCTELVFIMDKSGSMEGLERDTIGGFNSMLRKQKEGEGEVFVSTVFFSNDSQVIHDRRNIQEIKELTEKDYVVGGCTALIDAIGGAIHHISNVHKYIRKEDIPEHTLFVITTDGMENASHIYSSNQVKEMIEAKKKESWEFIFMGANIDAVETAKHFGIAEDRAVNYVADPVGVQYSARICDEAISMLRAGRKLDKHWKAAAEADFQNRKGGKK